MSDFVSDFMKQYGPTVSKQLSSNLGLKKSQASQLIPQVIPMILGGLKRQMQTQGGAPRLDHILNKYGSEDVLGNISQVMIEKSHQDEPDPRLGGLLGDSGVQASELIGKKFGLSAKQAMSLIPMLAPLILGALSKRKNQPGGEGLGGLSALIDRDGDGQILDDIMGYLSPALNSGRSSRGGAGGILGGLLGSLLRRKR